MNYPIGDFLIQIKNAYMARKKQMSYQRSKTIFEIAKLLEKEGYVGKIKEVSDKERKMVVLDLKYVDHLPAIKELRLVSKPSVHHYVDRSHLRKAADRHGIGIISTSRGIMTNKQAEKVGVGGELICQIY